MHFYYSGYEEFIWWVVLEGWVSYVVEEKIYVIEVVYEYECIRCDVRVWEGGNQSCAMACRHKFESRNFIAIAPIVVMLVVFEC